MPCRRIGLVAGNLKRKSLRDLGFFQTSLEAKEKGEAIRESVAVVLSGLLAVAAGLWLMLILSPTGNPIFLPTIHNAGWIIKRVKETQGFTHNLPL